MRFRRCFVALVACCALAPRGVALASHAAPVSCEATAVLLADGRVPGSLGPLGCDLTIACPASGPACVVQMRAETWGEGVLVAQAVNEAGCQGVGHCASIWYPMASKVAPGQSWSGRACEAVFRVNASGVPLEIGSVAKDVRLVCEARLG